MDFSIIKTAELTQGELAFMCNVSRQTALAWMNGKQTPHAHLEAVATRVLRAATVAVDEGRLPVAGNVPRARTRKGLTVRPDALRALRIPFETAVANA
jgi:DNA-binding XRE family transcriptional regulator